MTAAPIEIALPREQEQLGGQLDLEELRERLPKVPAPRYRHAAPSAPWPWMDFDQDKAEVIPLTPVPEEEPWSRYPQSHFGNWTPDQVQRCRMLTICKDEYSCKIYKVDVFSDGTFDRPENADRPREIPSDPDVVKEFWEELQKPVERIRVRAIFIENITLSVLQVLGARYNIEPFFFASSANWIPSRYQEDPRHREGDHITVVLPFIRAVVNQQKRASPTPSDPIYPPEKGSAPITDTKQTIDTQAPLILSDKKILLQDLLAIHMVREKDTNTIISYHHNSELQKTTAKRLRSLVQRTGDSVYWSKLYDRSKDATLVFLAMLWYALYAWDEALEVLYAHLSEQLEATKVTTHLNHTRELHKLQAHLLYYQQLLRDFKKSVEFVRDTLNPAMEDELDREMYNEVLTEESEHLLSEIERLEKQRQIQSDRLKNAMALAYSTVNIEDSRYMKDLTVATMRDSSAMKLISYLTMVFLPASYLSSVFGMNVAEINPGTLEHLSTYVESTVILTAITAWVIIALQDHSTFHRGKRDSVVRRIAWPIIYGYKLVPQLMEASRVRFAAFRDRLMRNRPRHHAGMDS